MPTTLVCLPPAGAGPGLFRAWQRADPHILAPSIPGREGRFRETAPDSLEALADLLSTEIAPTLPGHYALFGYSMGGTVAWLIAARLIARGLPAPRALYVLGALPPDQLHSNTGRLHTLGSDAFWAEIGRIGGTPDEVLNDPDLRALFEPPLRHDFGLCGRFRPGASPFRLPCPIHAFVAENDHLVGPESASGWEAFTTGSSTLHSLPGNHMLDNDALLALRGQIRGLQLQGAVA